MKRTLLFVATIAMVSIITMHLQAQYQQEKQATLHLTRGEIEAIYSIIDDAAVPGTVRKPLLEKIAKSYQAAFAQPAPVKDTTKHKKP